MMLMISLEQQIESYVKMHTPVNPFLRDIITNKLREALFSSTHYITNMYQFREIVNYIDLKVPAEAIGSNRRYIEWISKRSSKEGKEVDVTRY